MPSPSPSSQPSTTVATLEVENRFTDPPTKETYHLTPDRTLKFGRDNRSNDHAYPSVKVSRNHLEFFAVSFDETVQPMIYVRDRQSNNGTYVNGTLIGRSPHVTPGRLLENGDVVTINSKLQFTARLPPMEIEPLTEIQSLEIKLFEDQYRISNTVLGTGGSTTVRVAYDVKNGQQLACKIYDLRRMLSPNEVRKLMCGLDIIVQLEHPNIASFKRAYKSKHTVYVFEEIATGGDLFSMASSMKRFSELEIQWMMRQVLMAVDYLHKKGVVHRDIKSENVLAMVCPQPAHRLALTDFGHADLAGKAHGSVGTCGWQAPEHFQEGAYHGRPLDMWSIGIMAVHLLCGHNEVATLNTLEDALPKDPYVTSIDHASVIREINAVRCESAAGQALRDDFIRRCLEPDQFKRMTAAEALDHPWVNESAEMRRLFNTRQEQNTQAWSPRRIDHQPIRELQDVLTLESSKKKTKTNKIILTFDKSKKKVASTTNSDSESPCFKDAYKVTKPSKGAQEKTDDETADRRASMQSEPEMTPWERMRPSDKGGKYRGRGRPAGKLTRSQQDAKYENQWQLLKTLRKNKLKFLPRSVTWPYTKAAGHIWAEDKEKKRARSGDESEGAGPVKKRKVVRDPSDGKPINFEDPWTPI